MSTTFPVKIQKTLENADLQSALYTATGRLIGHRKDAVAESVLPEYQELRNCASALKRHTIDHLDYYLQQLESNVQANGGKVVWCRDATEVADFVLELAKRKQARLIVKSKSMTTEEIDLNERLIHHDLEAVETDLGEYIVQLRGERPYHIVAPALHLTRYDVAQVFAEKLGVPNETVIEKTNPDCACRAAGKVSKCGHRHQRCQFLNCRFRCRGAGGKRRKCPPDHHRTENPYRCGGH